jgi:hypothetical protein
VTPGIITSIYLASGRGRTGDASTGKQVSRAFVCVRVRACVRVRVCVCVCRSD